MIFGALLGGVVLGYPLFLAFAVLLASVVNTFWGVPRGLLSGDYLAAPTCGGMALSRNLFAERPVRRGILV